MPRLPSDSRSPERFPWRDVPAYIAAQIAWRCRGQRPAALSFSAGCHARRDAAGRKRNAEPCVLEIVLTFLLMLVILSVSTGAKEKGITAGIAIGAVIALEAMFAGPICGASMNPVRSLAPAVVSGHLEHLWLYFAGPLLGVVLAVPACCGVREPDCCCSPSHPKTNNHESQPNSNRIFNVTPNSRTSVRPSGWRCYSSARPCHGGGSRGQDFHRLRRDNSEALRVLSPGLGGG